MAKEITLGILYSGQLETQLVKSAKKIGGIKIDTQPYPGFPTDLQAQIMVLMTQSQEISTIRENIFENRFMHVPELLRMGANISVNGGVAKVSGVQNLKGAQIMATDLRASISLIIAALRAEGESYISRIYHLDRGYEQIEQKFQDCGANIERITN